MLHWTDSVLFWKCAPAWNFFVRRCRAATAQLADSHYPRPINQRSSDSRMPSRSCKNSARNRRPDPI